MDESGASSIVHRLSSVRHITSSSQVVVVDLLEHRGIGRERVARLVEEALRQLLERVIHLAFQ
jgi:hypothetical protein